MRDSPGWPQPGVLVADSEVQPECMGEKEKMDNISKVAARLPLPV